MEDDGTLGMSLTSLEKARGVSGLPFSLNIPGYQLKNELGKGSFGTVYEALRQQTGQRVALKIVFHEGRLHWEYFGRELALLLDLEDHPYTLTVLDADLEHEPPYIVTPLVEGGSLSAHKGKPVPQVLRWIAQIAEALRYIHSKGVIHCDVKPSNVLVVQGGESIRVGDFGQSRRTVDGEVVWGTIGYMAPEQCLSEPGKRVTPSVSWDVYGFGATAYWLLTGRRARIQDSDQERMDGLSTALERADYYSQCLRENPLVAIRSLNPAVDPALAAIIERCLVIDPAGRTQAMRDVLEDLDRRRRGQPLLCLRPWSTRYRLTVALRRRTIQLSLLLLLLAVITAFYSLRVEREHQFAFHTESGIHAQESGRVEEAYLHWLAALHYRPGDAATRLRLSFMPVLRTFPHDGEVNDVSFSRSGRFLATASSDSTGRIWEVATGREIAKIQHRGRVQQIAFSPTDENLVATASWDGTCVLFDVAARRVRATLDHGAGTPGITSVIISPDGKLMATAGDDGSIRLWTIPEAKRLPLQAIASGKSGEIQHLAFNADSTLLGGLSSSQTAEVWDTSNGKAASDPMPSHGEINDIEFSPSGELATASDDRTVRLWEIPGGRLERTYKHDSRVNAVAFSGHRMAAGQDDGTVRVWDSESTPFDLPHARPVRTLDFSRDGSMLAVGTGAKKVLWSAGEPNGATRIWNVPKRQPVTDGLPQDGPVNEVLFHPDGHSLVTASGNGRRVTSLFPGSARLWEVPAGAQPAVEAPPVSSGGLQATVLNGSKAVVTDQGREIVSVTHGAKIGINEAALSPDGKLLLTAGEDGLARIWRVSGGGAVASLAHEGPVTAVVFSPSGERVVTASTSWNGVNSVRIWDTATAIPVSPPLDVQDPIVQIFFAENALIARAAGASYRWQMHIRSLSDRALGEDIVDRLRAHLDPVTGVVEPLP